MAWMIDGPCIHDSEEVWEAHIQWIKDQLVIEPDDETLLFALERAEYVLLLIQTTP